MNLINAHKILIGFAIALGALLAIYGLGRYASVHDTRALATGVAGLIVCAALVLYLRWFLRKRNSTTPG